MAIRDGAIAQGGIAHRGMATISSTALMRHGRQSLSLMEKVVAAGIARGALALGARPERIRVAVIDPYPIFRTGVVQAIARSEALLLVAEGATAADAQRALREAAPDLLLLDISLSECSVETVLGIAKNCARCQLVVLADVASVTRALATGAKATSSRASADRSWLLHSRPFTPPCLTSRLNWPHAC